MSAAATRVLLCRVTGRSWGGNSQEFIHSSVLQVAAAAKKLCSRLPSMEFDLSEFLEVSMEEMMAAETRKKVFVNVPLTFERPTGLRAAKGDLTAKYFKFA